MGKVINWAAAAAGLALTAALLVTPTAVADPATGPTGPTTISCARPLGERCRIEVRTGRELAYTETGPVDGPAMVLLHGLTNSADAWVPVMRELHKRLPRWRLLAVDLRGHGSSFVPDADACATAPQRCLAIDTMAADVTRFLTALDLAPVVLAGHSMGSLVAQRVALDRPGLVRDLVLVGTTSDARRTPILGSWLVDQVILGRWRDALTAQGITWPRPALTRTPLDADPDAVAWLQTYWNVYPVSPQRDTTRIARQTARVPIGTWLGATRAILGFADTARLRSLSVPALVLWGTQDVFFGRDDQDLLLDALTVAAGRGEGFCWKQYGVRPLPPTGLQADDLGHNLTWEAPRQVAGDIAAFVRTGRPTPTGYTSGADGAVLPAGRAPVECRDRTGS